MSNQTENQNVETQDCDGLLTAYSELCRSYNAIREFRAKLLGFLPLASAGGVFLLLNAGGATIGPVTILTVGVLGCLITAGLYIYEQHNMERCHGLIHIGAKWEEKGLNLKRGQFMMRVNNNQGEIVAGSQYRVAATLIYGAVFLGWFYVAIVGLLRAIESGGSWLGLV